MSKFTKLINNPILFFNDALINRKNKSNLIIKNLKSKSDTVSANKKIDVPSLNYNLSSIKLNLVVVDFMENYEFKSTIIKYRCRTIEKYTDFDNVYYISEKLTTSRKDYKVFKSYQSFYDGIISKISPKREFFIFVDLNFFFLKRVKISDFINPLGVPYTYIIKSLNKKQSVDEMLKNILPGVDFNFSSITNYCCVDNGKLIHYHEVYKRSKDISFYLYDFLPIANSVFSKELIKSTPIQYANLNGGYMEKFIWIKSVHGSKRCPLAVTFNHAIKSKADLEGFLVDIVPHKSKLEKDLIFRK